MGFSRFLDDEHGFLCFPTGYLLDFLLGYTNVLLEELASVLEGMK